MAVNILPSSKKTYLMIIILVFLALIGAIFAISYLLAGQVSQKSVTIPTQTGAPVPASTQQIRKITFKNLSTQESIELWADGTINHFDKNGNLIKTGRRGFAETISKFKDLEKLINGNKKITGYDGFQIIIETEQGTIIVNPGDQGDGGDVIDDIYDYIDDTLNPTPRPSATPIPIPSSTPLPSTSATPQPSGSPEVPVVVPPFDCSDYYKSGKAIKISNIICGPQTNP